MIELDELVSKVDYRQMAKDYVPSKEALFFINFIKLVNGTSGEENKSPLIHLYMIDQMIKNDNNLFVAARGTAKTTVIHEYMYLFLATYGTFFDFGEVNVAFYVSDTIDNGVKSMRQNLEFRYNKSEFLQKYIPYTRFTDVRWEFQNLDGKFFCVRGFGASTGVRGFKEYGQRPTWAGFDDLMSDKNAESPTITRDIKNIIYKAARQALHPKKRKINWTGTPFNKKDPLYEAASSKGWTTSVYPLAQEFSSSTTKEEFVGAWEDRFPYEFVKKEYDDLLASGEIHSFNQELMLRISSEDDRLVQDNDIVYVKRREILRNKENYNFYITTDFATSIKTSADFSAISVWAYTSNGDWILVDVVLQRQLMDSNIKDLFRLVQMYNPLDVGIEVTGQQGGFIPWIREQMIEKNIYFNLREIKPTTNKLVRFNTILPMFKSKKIWITDEIKESKEGKEILDELRNATKTGFKSRHDDWLDTVSQLALLEPYKPSSLLGSLDDNEPVKSIYWDDMPDNTKDASGSTIF